jgi:hypothetical protein
MLIFKLHPPPDFKLHHYPITLDSTFDNVVQLGTVVGIRSKGGSWNLLTTLRRSRVFLVGISRSRVLERFSMALGAFLPVPSLVPPLDIKWYSTVSK